MHYVVKVEKGDEGPIFAVGYWEDNDFTPVGDFESEAVAYAFINYLNGGSGEVFKPFKD